MEMPETFFRTIVAVSPVLNNVRPIFGNDHAEDLDITLLPVSVGGRLFCSMRFAGDNNNILNIFIYLYIYFIYILIFYSAIIVSQVTARVR